ncbi:MAG: glycosyltransferase [Eubacteriales bacterium]|nr:glycosyltransferase [Eubacteriales bacterium]
MIKIAFVIPNMSYGGAQTMLARLVDKLDKTKFDIAVFVRDSYLGNKFETDLINSGIKCVYMDIGENEHHNNIFLHKIKSYFLFCKSLSEFKPDIVHSHLDLFYSFLYAIFNRKKLIITIHSQPERITNTRLKIFIKILKKMNCLYIVGCAKCVTDKVKEMWNVKKASTIYNPINLCDYNPYGQKSDNEFKYIHIGRLHPIKNQSLLLKAFKGVLSECPKSSLIIVGDGSMREQLESLSKELDIQGNVKFLGNRSDIPDLLADANVFVLSSDSECCPMTVLEAISSGIPVVSTDVGGVGEIIGDGGMLVEKGNVKLLSNAMIEIQKNKEKYDEMKEIALERSKRFDSLTIAKQHEELYIFFSDGE